MKGIKFKKPIIDIGCGDGSFSFTNFGGRVGSSFDVYRSIKSTSGFFKGVDIHNQNLHIKPKIIQKPKMKIDVGLDWKTNLLKKANELKLYEKLIQHDEEFETVFSNAFYWINDIESILKEAKRICTKNGKIIIFVPDQKFKDSLIYNQFLKGGYTWAKILDRGIYKNTKHCYALSKWKTILSNVGLKIEQHSNYATEKLTKIWSIGMRPYSPFIIEMANTLKLNERTKIKKRVVSEIFPILRSSNACLIMINSSSCPPLSA